MLKTFESTYLVSKLIKSLKCLVHDLIKFSDVNRTYGLASTLIVSGSYKKIDEIRWVRYLLSVLVIP